MHSFDLKFDRAERHILEVQEQVDAYIESDPITLRPVGLHEVAIDFAEVPVQTAVIVADVIYNLRSGLDHLAAALVPKKYRRDTMFPIYFKGVWEPEQGDDNDEQKKSRERWTTTTRHMHPDAVEVLKHAQPTHRSEWGPSVEHVLTRLNRLANKDKHSELVVVGGAATGLDVVVRDAQGDRFATDIDGMGEPDLAGPGMTLRLPPDTAAVEVTGGAAVFLVFDADDGVLIPEALREPLLSQCRRVANALREYVG